MQIVFQFQVTAELIIIIQIHEVINSIVSSLKSLVKNVSKSRKLIFFFKYFFSGLWIFRFEDRFRPLLPRYSEDKNRNSTFVRNCFPDGLPNRNENGQKWKSDSYPKLFLWRNYFSDQKGITEEFQFWSEIIPRRNSANGTKTDNIEQQNNF